MNQLAYLTKCSEIEVTEEPKYVTSNLRIVCGICATQILTYSKLESIVCKLREDQDPIYSECDRCRTMWRKLDGLTS